MSSSLFVARLSSQSTEKPLRRCKRRQRTVRASPRPVLPATDSGGHRFFFKRRCSLTARRDLAHSEGPTGLRLAGAAVDIQFPGEHPDTCQVVDVVGEHREITVGIGDGGALPKRADVLVDQRGAFGKQGGNVEAWPSSCADASWRSNLSRLGGLAVSRCWSSIVF